MEDNQISSSIEEIDIANEDVNNKLKQLDAIICKNEIEYTLTACIILVMFRSKQKELTLKEIIEKVTEDLNAHPKKIFSLTGSKAKKEVVMKNLDRSIWTSLYKSKFLTKVKDGENRNESRFKLNYDEIKKDINKIIIDIKLLSKAKIFGESNNEKNYENQIVTRKRGRPRNESAPSKKKINNSKGKIKNKNGSNTEILLDDDEDDEKDENKFIKTFSFLKEKFNLAPDLLTKNTKKIKEEIQDLQKEINEKNNLLKDKKATLKELEKENSGLNKYDYEKNAKLIENLLKNYTEFTEHQKTLVKFRGFIESVNGDKENLFTEKYREMFDKITKKKDELLNDVNILIDEGTGLEEIIKALISDDENKKCSNLFNIKDTKNLGEEIDNFLIGQLNEVRLEESTGAENSVKSIKKEKVYSQSSEDN